MKTTKKVIMTCLVIDAIIAMLDLAILNPPLFSKLISSTKETTKKAGKVVKNILKDKDNG
jgi:hypothetical protein